MLEACLFRLLLLSHSRDLEQDVGHVEDRQDGIELHALEVERVFKAGQARVSDVGALSHVSKTKHQTLLYSTYVNEAEEIQERHGRHGVHVEFSHKALLGLLVKVYQGLPWRG
jgi:hypothetical protein